VIVAYGGEVAWSDIFASPDLFNAYWSKLLRSYAVEALGPFCAKSPPTMTLPHSSSASMAANNRKPTLTSTSGAQLPKAA